MALFEVPKRINKDNQILKKVKSAKKVSSTIKGGGILGRINEIKAAVEKNLGHLKDNYVVITDELILNDYLESALYENEIAIDTETTGLDPLQDDIVGVCIYVPTRPAAYIPINHISYVTGVRVENQLSKKQVADFFWAVCDNNTDIIMHNAKFDIRVIRNQLDVKNIYCTWDTMLAARVLNENEESNGLKQLWRKYCNGGKGDAFNFDSLFNGISFDRIPINTGYLYAANDAQITYELYRFQQQYLRLDHERPDMADIAWLFFNIEMPCVNVVADMEDTGVLLDLKYAGKLAEKYSDLLKEKQKRFYDLCSMCQKEIDDYRKKYPDSKIESPINIASPTQIAVLLYDILGVKSVDKKSPRGTGEPILQKIKEPDIAQNLCKSILEYREIAKLMSTYIEKLPECVNPKDGRIHCHFNQYGAQTGRFSSSDPNLQNIPSHNKDIRKMFIATPGYVLMSSDYSQQEPKVMTQMCGDPKMIKAYQEGKDLYAEIASLAFNKPYEECLEFRPDGTTNKDGKERRSQAKSILLGVLYGRGVPSIAEQLGTTTKKAQQIKDSVFKGFPAIPKFEQDSYRMAEELGYVTTLWGRKRRLPDLQLPEYEFKWKDGAPPDDDLLDFDDMNTPEYNESEVPEDVINYYLNKLEHTWGNQKRKVYEEANEEGIWIIDNGGKIADAQRQAVNSRIQGSAADLTKLAMILINEDKQLKEWGFRLLIPVHDELIAECPIENAKRCRDRFSHLMSEAAKGKLDIPISCDVVCSLAWYGEEFVIND